MSKTRSVVELVGWGTDDTADTQELARAGGAWGEARWGEERQLGYRGSPAPSEVSQEAIYVRTSGILAVNADSWASGDQNL